MTILGIDTSNKSLGVILGEGEKIISSYYSQASKNHSETLMPAIDFCIKESKLTPQTVDKILVAKGPGSYTGLRIGVTTAKTLSWTLNVPLFSISSLACLAQNIQETKQLIVPFMDARRGFLYTGAYAYENGRLINVLSDRYIAFEEWSKKLLEMTKDIVFIGEDIGKLDKQLDDFISNHQATVKIQPSDPAVMLKLSHLTEKVDDVDAFVPTYLKKVEAEEEWLKKQTTKDKNAQNYVERLS